MRPGATGGNPASNRTKLLLELPSNDTAVFQQGTEFFTSIPLRFSNFDKNN